MVQSARGGSNTFTNASEISVLILTKSDSAVLWIAFICWIIDVVETAYREELGGGKSPTW